MDSNYQTAMPLFLPLNDSVVTSDDQQTSSFTAYGVLNPVTLGISSSSRSANINNPTFALNFPVHPYLLRHGSTNMERSTSLQPSSAMKCSDNSLMSDSSAAYSSSYSRQGEQIEKNEIQKQRKTSSSKDPSKAKSKNCRNWTLVDVNQEPITPTQISKKPRLNVQQDSIEHQFIQGFFKELNNRNPQVEFMIKHHLQKTQMQQLISNHFSPQLMQVQVQSPKQQIRGASRQQTYSSSINGDLCSRRFMQYLYHLNNRAPDNGIGYWKRFVSEYYAPGAKKRWCFCKFQNVELHGTNVFCPKNMEIWSCGICGSRSGRGLEATFELLPVLYKKKFEAGMLDEMLSLDFPQALNTSFGLVIEYKNATQVSVYANCRIVHKGKLRLVFRHDLKILSWEFCAINHEEFLCRTAIIPQINKLVCAAQGFRNNNQHDASSSGISPADLNRFALAKDQLKRSMELPIVNDLGYPKQFIRCLQISEVFNTMKDLMDLSLGRSLGPIESLNEFVRGRKIDTSTKERQVNGNLLGSKSLYANIQQATDENRGISNAGKSNSIYFNDNHRFLAQNSYNSASERKGHANESHTRLVDRSKQKGMSPTLESRNSSPRNAPQMFTMQKSQLSECDQNAHKALVDKILREMTSAKRVKNAQETRLRLGNEALSQSTFTSLPNGPMQASETQNDDLGCGEISSAASATQLSSEDLSRRNCDYPMTAPLAIAHKVTVKAEPRSPQKLPEAEAYLSMHADSSGIGDFYW